MTLSLTTEVTQKDYEAAIPKECSYETMQAHLDMMLCWGLKVSLEKGIPMDCTGCDETKANSAARVIRTAACKAEIEATLSRVLS
jgi:hypothetical protein